MTEVREFIGIDISKATFNVHSPELGDMQYPNDKVGFNKLLDQIDSGDCCVMEASGAYHHKLAEFLFENEIMVSVTNGLVVKRYGQMKF